MQIVFDGEVIVGTRAKKTHTKSYNAFSSTNYPLIALIKDGKIVQYIHSEKNLIPTFYHKMNSKVALLKLIPGSSHEMLDFLLEKHDAIIIESFGTGGVPATFYNSIRRATHTGKLIVVTTQVPNEGSDMTVYKVGKDIKESLGLLEAYDMTLEAVITKLMWALGVSRDMNKVKKRFNTQVNCDILLGE